jgi:tetratricopeptide (TPR) repeat protein
LFFPGLVAHHDCIAPERRIEMSPHGQRRLALSFLLVLILLGGAVYLPGASGPWVFDDFGNIVHNDYLMVTRLDTSTLSHAAFSLQAGPLQRPLAMLSFALNYYFSGGFGDTTPYKLTNIAIHVTNGLLVFWLALLVLRQLAPAETRNRAAGGLDEVMVLAALVALWWVVHPLQLTSVLYVVQRMTSLSALFVLCGLIGYFHGRLAWNAGQRRRGTAIAVSSLVGFGAAGMLSKENAVALPLFAVVIDATVFGALPPWARLAGLPRRTRAVLWSVAAGVVLLFTALAVFYFSSRYGARDFTLSERLLTEARVLFFYLALLLFPRIDWFGGQHDDITLSHSLVQPWTTLPAVAGLLILVVVALRVRRSAPILSFAVLWFLAGHLLESTFIPLEIAHEHRNYLPILGPMLAIGAGAAWVAREYRSRLPLILLSLLIALSAVITTIRSGQWANNDVYTYFEALHHPSSPRAQAGLASVLAKQGDFAGAISRFGRAAALDPHEPGYPVNRSIVISWSGHKLPQADEQALSRQLRTDPITPLTQVTMQYAVGCLTGRCRSLQKPMEAWLRVIVDRFRSNPSKRSFYDYLLGRTLAAQGRVNEAISYLRRSHEEDRNYLHPLFMITDIYLEHGQMKQARKELEILRQANRVSLYPRDRDIERLAAKIHELEARPQGGPAGK